MTKNSCNRYVFVHFELEKSNISYKKDGKSKKCFYVFCLLDEIEFIIEERRQLLKEMLI
jgi:hypothetical protein